MRSLLAAKTNAALINAKQQIANEKPSTSVTNSKFESDASERIRALRADVDRIDARWREASERINALEQALSGGSKDTAKLLLLPKSNQHKSQLQTGGDSAAVAPAVADPDPAAWIKEKMRSQVLRILNDKVYDVTADGDFGMRLDLLNDVHRELDQIVNQCACGSDGASNNDLQRQVYLNLSMNVRPTVICETGFNAGHAAAALLLGTRKRATYIGFDLMSRRYSKRSSLWLATLFDSATLQVIEGSSGLTAPRFFGAQTDAAAEVECDVVHIDGGRFQGMPLKDLRTFHAHSREGATVIMDDVQCDATNAHICREPGSAWKRLVQEGKIAGEKCYEKADEGVHFCIGQFRHTHA